MTCLQRRRLCPLSTRQLCIKVIRLLAVYWFKTERKDKGHTEPIKYRCRGTTIDMINYIHFVELSQVVSITVFVPSYSTPSQDLLFSRQRPQQHATAEPNCIAPWCIISFHIIWYAPPLRRPLTHFPHPDHPHDTATWPHDDPCIQQPHQKWDTNVRPPPIGPTFRLSLIHHS